MNRQFITTLLKEPPFNLIMSKNARALRDDVYMLCFSHCGYTSLREFVDEIKEQYDRIYWETAIYYHHNERIFEGILRRTSVKFEAKPKKGEDPATWQRGTKATGAARNKKIDWLKLAIFDDIEFWREMIDFPRTKLAVYPKQIKLIQLAFTAMYELITGWLFADFNYTSLYHIYEFARDDSLSFVEECMDKVEDPRKHSTSYLQAIMQQERAIQKEELLEADSVVEFSKQVIHKMVDMVDKHEPIDWDQIETNASVGEENRSVFDKVKLS